VLLFLPQSIFLSGTLFHIGTFGMRLVLWSPKESAAFVFAVLAKPPEFLNLQRSL
jgi:hypothetical protein